MSRAASYAAYNRTTKGRFRELKRAAKRRGLPFELTIGDYEFMLSHPCIYCDVSLKDEGGAGYWLDRVDNNEGYTINNVLPCCGRCNRIRGADLTVEDMFEIGETLAKKRLNMDNNTRKKSDIIRLNLHQQRDFRVFLETHLKNSYWADAQGHIMEAYLNASLAYWSKHADDFKGTCYNTDCRCRRRK